MAFKIIYNGNHNTGGFVPTDTKSYTTGAVGIISGNVGALTRGTDVFAYWNTLPDGTGQHYGPNDHIVIASSDVVLYAQWYTTANLPNNGETPNFKTIYIESPDSKNLRAAQAIVANCEKAFSTLKQWFGVHDGFGPLHKIQVRIERMTWTSSWAWNGGYDLGIIDVNADVITNDSNLVAKSMFLFVAELAEIFMDYRNKPPRPITWVLNNSAGEGLSLFCASELYPVNDPNFIRINAWLQLPNRNNTSNDFIISPENSDSNIISYGQSLLFIYYLKSQLNFSEADIIQKAGFSLDVTYYNLTGRLDAGASLSNLLDTFYPIGHTPYFNTNNIFPLLKSSKQGGFLIWSTFSQHGNFEILVPQENVLQHFWRDNDAPGSPWHRGRSIVIPPSAPPVIMSYFSGVRILQSNYNTPAYPGNFEVIYRTSLVIGKLDRLGFGYHDSMNDSWHGPFDLKVDGKFIDGVTGNPAFLQSTFGVRGNFELMVPQRNLLQHYWRDNDALGAPWHKGHSLALPATKYFSGVCMFQSSYNTPAYPGNFEFICRISPATGHGDYLGFGYHDSASAIDKWNGPWDLQVGGKLIDGVTGDPSVIQSRSGNPGNFEMLVPSGNTLVHYWRDNSAPDVPWKAKTSIKMPASTDLCVGVSLIQLRPTWSDNLAAVIMVKKDASNNVLLYSEFDSITMKWTTPSPIIADGSQITKITGF